MKGSVKQRIGNFSLCNILFTSSSLPANPQIFIWAILKTRLDLSIKLLINNLGKNLVNFTSTTLIIWPFLNLLFTEAPLYDCCISLRMFEWLLFSVLGSILSLHVDPRNRVSFHWLYIFLAISALLSCSINFFFSLTIYEYLYLLTCSTTVGTNAMLISFPNLSRLKFIWVVLSFFIATTMFLEASKVVLWCLFFFI